MADRVRDLAGRAVDLVFDAPPPNAGSIPELIAIAGDPGRVMTISNHDEARRLGARVNLDYIAGLAPAATFMPQYASLAADGAFYIPIARTYPLDEWRNAVKLSMSGHPMARSSCSPKGAGFPTRSPEQVSHHDRHACPDHHSRLVNERCLTQH